MLAEVPADFQKLKSENLSVAQDWRFHTRQLFERFFTAGYLVTDFVYLPGAFPRSYYAFTHGDSSLSEGFE